MKSGTGSGFASRIRFNAVIPVSVLDKLALVLILIFQNFDFFASICELPAGIINGIAVHNGTDFFSLARLNHVKPFKLYKKWYGTTVSYMGEYGTTRLYKRCGTVVTYTERVWYHNRLHKRLSITLGYARKRMVSINYAKDLVPQ